jgi:hypothetical protein
MKESNSAPDVNCDGIEQLLIKKNFEELTDQENRLIQEHLRSCDVCRSYQSALLRLKDSMRISAEDKLAPDPSIHETVIKRMRNLKPQEAGFLGRAYQSVMRLFEYRIPVYQALSGAVLVVLIFLAVKQFSFTAEQKTTRLHNVAQIETSIPAQMRVMDDLGIIDQQKIGQNVKDDTTLTRFIVTTM